MNPCHHLFIGPYTRDGSKGVYSLQLDAGSGQLTEPVLAAGAVNPSYLTLSPDGRHLYAVSESEAMAAAFEVAADRARLVPLQNAQPAGGRAPCHLAVDRSDRVLLVANYHTGIVASLPLNSDGTLRPAASVIQHTGHSVNPERQSSPHVHCVTVSPDNCFVLVCDLGLDRIYTYRMDLAAGTLAPADAPFTTTPAGTGPRHLAFAHGGRCVFCISEMGGTLTSYRYDPDRGALAPVEIHPTAPADFRGENAGAAVRLHPNGRFVYASNRGPNVIAVFALDEATGRLAPVETVDAGGKGPRDFALTPDGRWLVVAHQYSGNLAVFKVDEATGRLSPTPHTARISTPVCVLFAD